MFKKIIAHTNLYLGSVKSPFFHSHGTSKSHSVHETWYIHATIIYNGTYCKCIVCRDRPDFIHELLFLNRIGLTHVAQSVYSYKYVTCKRKCIDRKSFEVELNSKINKKKPKMSLPASKNWGLVHFVSNRYKMWAC